MRKEFFIRILSSLILIPIVLFFIVKGSFFFNFFSILILSITLYEWHSLSFKKIYYLPGLVFIFFSFYTFYLLRNEESLTFFLLILLTCIATDLGGYIFGKLLKGPKLTKLSPKKTYAGMIGSYTLCILFYVFVANFKIFNVNNFISFFIFVIIISSISQLGDIIISYFKRLSKIKDTGNIIPGHGGLLDRIDGMLFAFPTSYLILMFDFFKIFI